MEIINGDLVLRMRKEDVYYLVTKLRSETEFNNLPVKNMSPRELLQRSLGREIIEDENDYFFIGKVLDDNSDT